MIESSFLDDKVSLSAPVFDHKEKNSAIKAINN